MEQSYKEKYEDILARLERAKNDNEVCDERFCCVINDLFPELAESEGEKVREEIMALIEWSKSYSASGITNDDAKKMLAWLERQGEHANFRNKIQVGDKVTRNEAGVLVNLSQLNRVAKKMKIKVSWQKEKTMVLMDCGTHKESLKRHLEMLTVTRQMTAFFPMNVPSVL